MAIEAFVAVALVLAAQAQPESSTQSTFLTAVARGYDENRAKFTRGSFRFEYQDGRADGPEEARRGEASDLCTASCVYVFNRDGKNPHYRYSREFTAEDTAAHTIWISDGRSSTHLFSFRAVSNGTLTLFDQIGTIRAGGLSHNSEILSGVERLFQFAEFPLELGFPDRGLKEMPNQIRAALKGEEGASVGQVEEKVEIDGRSLARFTLKLRNGDVTYLVDPGRGWVPIGKHTRMKNDTNRDQYQYYDDVRLVERRGWLPFVRTVYFAKIVRRIVVREADFERAVKSSDFDLEFAEPRSMVNSATGLWYRNPKKIWNLASLPSPSSAKTEKIKRPPEPASSAKPFEELPGEREPWPWYLSPVVIGAIGIIGVATVALAVRARR